MVIFVTASLLIFIFVFFLCYNRSKYAYLFVSLIFGMLACAPVIMVNENLMPVAADSKIAFVEDRRATP